MTSYQEWEKRQAQREHALNVIVLLLGVAAVLALLWWAKYGGMP